MTKGGASSKADAARIGGFRTSMARRPGAKAGTVASAKSGKRRAQGGLAAARVHRGETSNAVPIGAASSHGAEPTACTDGAMKDTVDKGASEHTN